VTAQPIILLAADTGTSINTVAVCEGMPGLQPAMRILAENVVDCKRLHSERLIETVDWTLKEACITLDDVNVLAIAVGPGSFTGLRIGASTWKGLAYSKNLPLVAVPSLDAMTHLGAFYDATVCPMLDARMKEVYGAVYRFRAGQREKISLDRVCPVEDLLTGLTGPVHVLGDGAAVYEERIRACLPKAVFVSGPCAVPRASCVAQEAFHLLALGVSTDPECVAPDYIRPSQAEINRAAQAPTPSS